MKLGGPHWLAAATLIAATADVLALASTSHLWDKHFLRASWLSSLIVGDYLYIDGGEIAVSTGYRSRYYGSTLRINLKSSWTNSSVTADYVDKPLHYPWARAELLWTDGSNLYAYGGIRYFFHTCIAVQACGPPIQYGNEGKVAGPYLNPKTHQIDKEPLILLHKLSEVETEIWKLPLDNFEASTWTKADIQAPHSLSVGQGSIVTSYGNKTFFLGGSEGLAYGDPDFNPLKPVSGLTTWSPGRSWGDHSTHNLDPAGFAAMGEGVAAPFGRQGALIYIGGYAPPSNRSFQYASYKSPLRNLSQIVVYDIASDTFISQTATGDVPSDRFYFCALGTADSNSETFDIYVYGGFYYLHQGSPQVPSAKKFYVLSLPEFIWTEVPDSSQYGMRSAPTCQLVRQSQMLIIGGNDPTDTQTADTPDPWTNGIGIFDLNAWSWASKYDSSASPYKRHPKLVSLYQNQRYPHKWDSNLAKKIFQTTAWTYQNSGTSAGAIAGGVVGGVVGLALIVILAFLLLGRRKRRVIGIEYPSIAEAEGQDKRKFNELEGQEGVRELPVDTNPVEMGPSHVWELAGSDALSGVPTLQGTKSLDYEDEKNISRHEVQG